MCVCVCVRRLQTCVLSTADTYTHLHVYAHTHTLLRLTQGNWLCINTDSDLDLRWEGERGKTDGKKKKGWHRERERARERERSGTDREGGVIFVVGATKGGTENWRVWHLTLELPNNENTIVNGHSHWKFDMQQWIYLWIPGNRSLMTALFWFIERSILKWNE